MYNVQAQHWHVVLEEGEHVNTLPVIVFLSAAKISNLNADSHLVSLHD